MCYSIRLRERKIIEKARGQGRLTWDLEMTQKPSFMPVMANLGCHLDFIWNQLKSKLPGTPMRDFLDETF